MPNEMIDPTQNQKQNPFRRMKTLPALGETIVRHCSRAMKLTLVLGALACPLGARAALIGFYPFDGADPLADASGTGNNLTSAGVDPLHLPTGGFEGGAFSFDGSQRIIAP